MADSPTGYGVLVKYQVTHTRNGTVEPDPSREEVEGYLPSESSASAGEGDHRQEYRHIPVVVERSESEEVDMYCKYDDTPGGCKCNVNGIVGTIAASFYSYDYGYGWVLSGHVAQNGGGAGSEMSQPNSEPCGVIDEAYDNGDEKDYAFAADDYDGVRRSLRDPAEDACDSFMNVAGTVSDSTIQNDVDTSETYYIQGSSSRQKDGTIGAFYSNTGGDASDNRYNHSADGQDGDSGGPLYKLKDGDVYIAGLVDKDLYIGGNAGNTAAACQTDNGLDGYFLS